MANYQTIVRVRPEVRDFIRNRRWVNRGEAVAYGANTRCEAFSTDELGFRHSVFEGQTLSVADCQARQRYGVVLGSSHLYGFGLAGNENTIPSVLAERFGFPFANVSLPEANSRNLHSQLNGIMARAEHAPAVVIDMSGGDFTSFCFTGIADPVFGSPNLKQMEIVTEERASPVDPKVCVPALFSFTAMWTRMIVDLCRSRKVPVALINDTTFFEKAEPSEVERQCELGAPGPSQQRQFATHRAFFASFCAHRQSIGNALGIPIAGPGNSNALTYVDEFHYDRDGTRGFVETILPTVEGLLK